MQGSGCRVQGSEPRAQGSGFRALGSGFRVQGPGLRAQGSGFRVQGSGFRVQGSGFRVQGSGSRASVSGLTEAQLSEIWTLFLLKVLGSGSCEPRWPCCLVLRWCVRRVRCGTGNPGDEGSSHGNSQAHCWKHTTALHKINHSHGRPFVGVSHARSWSR